jgi:ubiquinone/menaquinone biosynthesis C-methylase UbiE
MDFYDPAKHTEISIRRARQAYPPAAEDVRVSASGLPIPANSAEGIFVLLAAHEIRGEPEREAFFGELRRVLKTGGRAVVLEHLRDVANALAYTAGVFHFIGEKTWLASFERAGLRIVHKIKPNPLMTCFVLERDEAAS